MENQNQRDDRQMVNGQWTCAGCGAEITELPFEPDGTRDIFCRDCHRKKREGKVLKALAVSGGGTLSDLVSHAYDDVSTELHRLAERSLLAHLLKLAREGVVSEKNSYWSVVKK